MSKKRNYDTYKKEASVQDLDRAHPATNVMAGLPRMQATNKTVYRENKYPPALPYLPPHLAEAPFRHASTSDQRRGDAILDYEHLEFLGDAYLETIATRLIFTRFHELKVGRQSALREKLVQNKTLAGYARMYGFDKKLQAVGIETATEKAKEKVLGDMIEAYIGALILSDMKSEAPKDNQSTSSSFDTVEAWLTALWVPILLQEDPNIAVVVNRKDELSRAVVDKGVKLEYIEDKPMFLSHGGAMQNYTVGVYITGWGLESKRLGQGMAVGKKEAGMRAAADALDQNPLVRELREKKVVATAERKKLAELRESNKTD